MQKQRSKIVKIYNKWEFIEGLIVLFGIGYILLLFLLIVKFSFWFPLALGATFGMCFIMFFVEIGWYVNIILPAIIAIRDGILSVPVSSMSPAQMGILILCIGIGIFGNSFGLSTVMLVGSLKKGKTK